MSYLCLQYPPNQQLLRQLCAFITQTSVVFNKLVISSISLGIYKMTCILKYLSVCLSSDVQHYNGKCLLFWTVLQVSTLVRMQCWCECFIAPLFVHVVVSSNCLVLCMKVSEGLVFASWSDGYWSSVPVAKLTHLSYLSISIYSWLWGISTCTNGWINCFGRILFNKYFP